MSKKLLLAQALLLNAMFLTAHTMAHAEPEQVTTFIPAEGDQETGFPSDDTQKTGIEVSTLVVNSQSDLNQIVADAKEIVRKARETDPDQGPLKILLVTRNPEFSDTATEVIAPQQVGELIQTEINDTISFKVSPTKELSSLLKAPLNNPYEENAKSKIAKARTTISIFRFIISGGVSLVALAISDLPLPAVVAGGLLAGTVSASLQMKNDLYKNWLISKAWWDKEDHRESKHQGWMASYAIWKSARITGLLCGYLGAIQLISGSLGGPTPFLDHPFQWASKIAVTAAIAAASEGPWMFADAQLRRSYLNESWIKNVDDPETGKKEASKILMRSQVAALALSAAATFSQVLSTGGGDSASRPIMIGIGITGSMFYLWKCTNIADYAKTFVKKLGEGINAAGSVCQTLFGGM